MYSYSEMIKVWAGNVAPNPFYKKYWIDLATDPTGKVVKIFDGITWVPMSQGGGGGSVNSVNGITPDSSGNIQIPDATISQDGLMSSEDKEKLENISTDGFVKRVSADTQLLETSLTFANGDKLLFEKQDSTHSVGMFMGEYGKRLNVLVPGDTFMGNQNIIFQNTELPVDTTLTGTFELFATAVSGTTTYYLRIQYTDGFIQVLPPPNATFPTTMYNPETGWVRDNYKMGQSYQYTVVSNNLPDFGEGFWNFSHAGIGLYEQLEVGSMSEPMCLNHNAISANGTVVGDNIIVNYRNEYGEEVADNLAYLSQVVTIDGGPFYDRPEVVYGYKAFNWISIINHNSDPISYINALSSESTEVKLTDFITNPENIGISSIFYDFDYLVFDNTDLPMDDSVLTETLSLQFFTYLSGSPSSTRNDIEYRTDHTIVYILGNTETILYTPADGWLITEIELPKGSRKVDSNTLPKSKNGNWGFDYARISMVPGILFGDAGVVLQTYSAIQPIWIRPDGITKTYAMVEDVSSSTFADSNWATVTGTGTTEDPLTIKPGVYMAENQVKTPNSLFELMRAPVGAKIHKLILGPNLSGSLYSNNTPSSASMVLSISAPFSTIQFYNDETYASLIAKPTVFSEDDILIWDATWNTVTNTWVGTQYVSTVELYKYPSGDEVVNTIMSSYIGEGLALEISQKVFLNLDTFVLYDMDYVVNTLESSVAYKEDVPVEIIDRLEDSVIASDLTGDYNLRGKTLVFHNTNLLLDGTLNPVTVFMWDKPYDSAEASGENLQFRGILYSAGNNIWFSWEYDSLYILENGIWNHTSITFPDIDIYIQLPNQMADAVSDGTAWGWQMATFEEYKNSTTFGKIDHNIELITKDKVFINKQDVLEEVATLSDLPEYDMFNYSGGSATSFEDIDLKNDRLGKLRIAAPVSTTSNISYVPVDGLSENDYISVHITNQSNSDSPIYEYSTSHSVIVPFDITSIITTGYSELLIKFIPTSIDPNMSSYITIVKVIIYEQSNYITEVYTYNSPSISLIV